MGTRASFPLSVMSMRYARPILGTVMTSMNPTGILGFLTAFPSTKNSLFPMILLASLAVSQTPTMSLRTVTAAMEPSTGCAPALCLAMKTLAFLLRGQVLGAASLFMWSLIG